MIMQNQNHLQNPMKVGYQDIDVNHQDLQYQYVEISRIFYDRIRIKDPMTIYLIDELNGTHSIYFGENKIPKNYYYDIHPNIGQYNWSFDEWIKSYFHHLVVEYQNGSINHNAVEAPIICNILEATGKYNVEDLELYPLYLSIARNNKDLHNRLKYINILFREILDVFIVYDFCNMINKYHTEEDFNKFNINDLINSLKSILFK